MFAAIFEILPKLERFENYLALAKQLRPLLQKTDGFVDNERFESQTRRGWILSVSTWRDEKSVIRWRTTVAMMAGSINQAFNRTPAEDRCVVAAAGTVTDPHLLDRELLD